MELFCLSFEFYNYVRLSVCSSFNFERPMLHICLDDTIGKLSAYEPFSIKDCIVWILSRLVFSSISYQSFSFCKGHIRRCCPVSLIIGYNLDTIVLPHSYTRVSCSQIDSNCFRRSHFNFNKEKVADIFIGQNVLEVSGAVFI